MAEAALLSIALHVAGTAADAVFKKAFEKAFFIWEAKAKLEKIQSSMEIIQGTVLDAEKRQEGSEEVKALIKKLRDVLYKAEELFDKVATDVLLKQQMETTCIAWKKVHIFFSKLNPVLSGYSIANKAGKIEETLVEISNHMRDKFNIGQPIEVPDREVGGFGPKKVFGRDSDVKGILDFLNEKSHSRVAIVGIGGMGKSCLAQLVYNHKQIIDEFDKEGRGRWWACISNTKEVKEVTGKIYQSITGKKWKNLQLHQLQSGIKDCVSEKKEGFFLVLDDLWDVDANRWSEILALLQNDDVKGSKIIVTTRDSLVVEAMRVDRTHKLKGLTEDASWELFKNFAFGEELEIDSYREDLGREIVKMCANVPLAIRCIGSLPTENWESILTNGLPQIRSTEDPGYVMSVVKLSYDPLSPNIKQCFAYCSLFRKKSMLDKMNLIHLWMAQGYIKPDGVKTLEELGHEYFMVLVRRCFFEEEEIDENSALNKKKKEIDENGDIVSYKMHDLIHDLAKQVAGSESIMLVDGLSNIDENKFRHVSVGCQIGSSWNIPPPLLQPDHTRSFLFLPQNYPEQLKVDKVMMKLRLLRALSLEGLNNNCVPSSIGNLKYLRYLNLSRNTLLLILPDSITRLVNLLTLDLSGCSKLKVLPNEFRKLISLRHLDISRCESLKHMPSRFGELTSLQHISDFKVGRGGSGLGALVGLINLQGPLRISYDKKASWLEADKTETVPDQIPNAIDVLSIHDYPNARIPVWWKEDSTPLSLKLRRIKLERCARVWHLPSFGRLPYLRDLVLDELEELEYMEEEVVISNARFFPNLVFLQLTDLPKLKGWSSPRPQGVTTTNPEQPSFPKLSRLGIHNCVCLESLPPSPKLQRLSMMAPKKEMVEQLVSTNASSSSLLSITIQACSDLKSFPGEGLTSVRKLELRGWPALENVQLPSNASVEELTILRCWKLKLWDHGEEKTGLDWGCLPSLRELALDDQVPEPKELPNFLGQRIEQGLLQIKKIRTS